SEHFASVAAGIGLQQSDEHIEHARSPYFTEVGRETAALKRSGRHRAPLLLVLPKPTWMAARSLAERGFECEPRDFEHAADSGSRWWSYFVWLNRVDEAQTIEH